MWQQPAVPPTDQELIAQSLREPRAFGEIFDRHYEAVARYLGRRLQRADAEEAASETFTVAFRDRERFDHARSSALPWLFGIATNLARRRARSEMSRFRAYARVDHSPAEDATDRVVERTSAVAARPALIDGLTALSLEERDVLLLFAWGQLSYAEIAEALTIPVGTVRSRLARARSVMQRELAKDQSNHTAGVSHG